jgi:RNA-directed DNA polymerase
MEFRMTQNKSTTITDIGNPENILEGLPVIVDDTSLAELLDLTGSDLWGLLKSATRENAGTGKSLYKKWSIPKRSGGKRILYAPSGALKAIQTQIRDRIIDLAPKSPVSVAYRNGMCPGDTAKKIAGSKVILKLDIKNFFPSILQSYVKRYFLSLGYNENVSNLLGGLLCVKDGKRRFVCQGGTASPMLANRIAEMILDPKVLEELPDGWEYVRYCDNLYMWPINEQATKAGKHREILSNIRAAIYTAGFSSHQGSVVPYYRSQKLLGLSVNSKANMPRERYKLLRACLFNCSKHGFESQMSAAAKLGFQEVGDRKTDILRFKAFISGLLNYYKDYLTEHRVMKLRLWFTQAEMLDQKSIELIEV